MCYGVAICPKKKSTMTFKCECDVNVNLREIVISYPEKKRTAKNFQKIKRLIYKLGNA